MEIILENEIKKLIPTNEENYLISKEDIDKPEEERYYFKFAYLPPATDMDTVKSLYKEVSIPKEIE